MVLCRECKKEGIKKSATFGYEKDGKTISCKKHKTDEMIDTVHIKTLCIECKKEGIFKQASCGYLKDNKKTHCAIHKLGGMIMLTHKKYGCIECKKDGKFIIACFGLNKKEFTHCFKHKTDEMTLNFGKKCIVCGKIANFGLSSNRIKTHCKQHKTDKMINLVPKRTICIKCIEEGKSICATFGYPNDKPKFCIEHKEKEMINLKSINNICIICKKEGVIKRASFGLLTDKIATYCVKHKSKEMIDIKNQNKNCIECKKLKKFTQACYGYNSDKKATYCNKHKLEGMINRANTNCIVCLKQGIIKRACYGFLFEKKTHCAVHVGEKKNKKMFINNKPKWIECSEKPYFGDSIMDDLPVRCELHKLDTDVDMVTRKCVLCGDDYFIPSTETKCRGCRGFIVRKNNRGIKEKKITDLLFLLENKIGKAIHDRKVKGGCSNKRPDFYYKGFNPMFDLIIEVDEYQHSRYTCGIQAEMQRIINIYENDNGGFPLCIIRFNPDIYYYKGKTILSYKGREDFLKSTIFGLKNRTSFNYKIGIIYLFYDQFNTITSVDIIPFDYQYEKGKLLIKHKHPLSDCVNHIYSL